MADNFIVFNNVTEAFRSTFTVLDNGNILVGDHAAAQTLAIYDAAGDLLSESTNFNPGGPSEILHGTISDLVPEADGTFFAVTVIDAQIYYRHFNADMTPTQSVDQTIVSDTSDPGAVPGEFTNAFPLANGGMVVAFDDMRHFNDQIPVLSDGRTDIERYDARARFVDAAGTETTSDFLVQATTGSGLAGDQRQLEGVQLAGGNVAFVYNDVYYWINGVGGTQNSGAISISIFNTGGQVVTAPHQIAQAPADFSGNVIFFGTDIAALTGGGFVVAYGTGAPNVAGMTLHLQLFDAAGNTAGPDLTLPDNGPQGNFKVVGNPDGGFIVGYEVGTSTPLHLKLYKFDHTGTLVTQTQLDPIAGNPIQPLRDIQIAPDGQILVSLASGGQAADSLYSVILAGPNDVVHDGSTGTDTFVGSAGVGHANWLNGEGGDDTLTGGAGANHLFGKAGSDTLVAGTGTNEMIGGDGNDTAVFSGPRGNYSIVTTGASGTLLTTVTDQTHHDGTSTLVGVEHLQFTNGTFALNGADLTKTSNFDGHQFDDVLLQVASNGQLIFADMEAGHNAGFGALTSPLPAGFRIVGHADINGDGFADVVVQDSSTDVVLAAEQNGSGNGMPDWVALTSGLKGGGFDYRAVGIGDVNGDGTPDILLQNQGATGDDSILAVTGQSNGHPTFISVAPALKVAGSVDLTVVGVGDINGDGFADVVLQDQANGSSQILVRDLHNNNYTTYATSPGVLKVVGVGDVNGDGHADIVIQPDGGGNVLYLDPAGGLNDYKTVVNNIGNHLLAKGVADVDNDGIAEVLFQDTTSGDGSLYYRHVGAGDADGFWGAVAEPNNNAFHLV